MFVFYTSGFRIFGFYRDIGKTISILSVRWIFGYFLNAKTMTSKLLSAIFLFLRGIEHIKRTVSSTRHFNKDAAYHFQVLKKTILCRLFPLMNNELKINTSALSFVDSSPGRVFIKINWGKWVVSHQVYIGFLNKHSNILGMKM